MNTRRVVGILAAVALCNATAHAQEAELPVEPTVFVDGFRGAEGIAFSQSGQMYVTGGRTLWRVNPAGETMAIATLNSTVGLAGIGEEDVLVAEFGLDVRINIGDNDDGVVLRVSPDGVVDTVAAGMGDPNFILVRDDGSLLVSDDFTNEIWHVAPDGGVRLFTDAVNHPNGMVLSADEKTLYVAQIFEKLEPFTRDTRVWAVPLSDGMPSGLATVAIELQEPSAPDGLAMDALGRVYIGANFSGKVWRFDPRDGSTTLVAENLGGAASLAFGEGDFDRQSLYVTTGRDGRVLAIDVGVEGMPLVR